MAEDLADYFDTALGFAVAATLGAAAVTGIFDTESTQVFGDELVTQAPNFLLRSTESAAASVGTSLVIGATTYTVRAILAEPPDGVLTRLVLSRA
jgi:hypothetical protein